MREQIRSNRRRSIVLMVVLSTLLLSLGFVLGEAFYPGSGPLGALVGLVIFSVQYGIYIASPESLLLAGMGARELQREDSPRLFNVVEEMKIASGLQTMPRIYIMDDDAPNAFAIGRKPENSIVAVTSGLMHRLTRDELQGVVAHEMGHLKNRDVQFMTLAGVMLGSILILSEGAMRSAHLGGRGGTRSSSRDGNGGHVAFIILAVALVILAPLLARMLYFALSRSREYMADASAALFTRYPPGLAGALHKIAGAARAPANNSALAPMYIVNPRAAFSDIGGWFSTHPPTAERIRILNSMGGAGLADYENAFEKVKGKPLMSAATVASHPLESMRGAVAESAGASETAMPPTGLPPVETKASARTMVHSLYGYVQVDCDCGAKIRVPTSYDEPTVTCIRCGQRHEMPAAHERYAHELEKAGVSIGAGESAAQAAAEPMVYNRKSSGQWENFRCTCGGTVQLSPQFIAPRINCPKCRRMITING